MTQARLDCAKPRSLRIEGSATFTIVASRTIISIPAHRTTRASQRESPVTGAVRDDGAMTSRSLLLCNSLKLVPEDLVDEDDGDALGDDLAVDDQDLVHGAVDAVRRLGAGILQGEGVLVDPAEAFLKVRHDLLRPHDKDDSPCTAGVR